MGIEREERLALNETMFRAANDRMADWEERHSDQDTELYHCECSDLECRDKVRLSRGDYERVRADSSWFFILPGHEVPDIEVVIETRDGWAVVEKCAEVHDLVEAADPRAS